MPPRRPRRGGRGRGQPVPQPRPPSPSPPQPPSPSPPQSRQPSPSPSAASEDSTSKSIDGYQKRCRKTAYAMDSDEEQIMIEFLRENPLLWDVKLTDYRRADKKNKLLDDQATKMHKSAEYLRGWFKSLRDIFTRLDKKKSGAGAPDLTEREKWIQEHFCFMKTATRHRPEPVNSVKAVIEANPGNLDAAELECEELGACMDEGRSPSPTSSIAKPRKKGKDDEIIRSLQKRVNESGEILNSLLRPEPQPISESITFANYVRDSLLTMNKRKFRKVRSAINKVLTEAMEEDSDDETVLSTTHNSSSVHVAPHRSLQAYVNQLQSENYPPVPQVWRQRSPHVQSSVPTAQDYMAQYPQQPLHFQQNQNIMMPQNPIDTFHQQQSQQQNITTLSSVIGPATQVLSQNQNISDI